MKEIICISGDLYSGKSTIGEKLSEKLGYEYFSAGKMFRNAAINMGLNVIELNKVCGNYPEIDKLIDTKMRDFGISKNKIILDSRMAWYFVKNCFRVHLILEANEAAIRALKDNRRTSEKYDCYDAALTGIKIRKEAEVRRYMNKYNVDINAMKNYDLAIDTTCKNVEEVLDIIIINFNKYLNL